MFSVKLFGRGRIEGPEGPLAGRAAHRHRLALLALLALSRDRGYSRDRLIAFLWPESDGPRARHLLSDTVYLIRKELGEDAVLTVGDDLVLDRESVRSDVADFEEAVEAGEPLRAVELYGGPLLEGFHIADAPDFERWLDGERERLARMYAGALESLAVAEAEAGNRVAAADWWRRLAAHEPYNARIAVELMRALNASGDRAGALQHAAVFASLVEADLGAGPDSEVLLLAEELRRSGGAPSSAAAAPGPESRIPRPAGSGGALGADAAGAADLRSPEEGRTAGKEEVPSPRDASGLAPSAPVSDGELAARAGPRSTTSRVGVVLILALLVASLGLWLRPSPPEAGGTVRMTVPLPAGVSVARGHSVGSALAVSPDGRTIALVGTDADTRRLYVRSLDRLDAVATAGSEGAANPFFSPDGAWIGFFQDGRLRRVPAAGGAVVDIAPAPGQPLGASWGDDDLIVFASGNRTVLHQVSARGGAVEPLTTLEEGEVSHRHPELLPDGRTLLFVSLSHPPPQREWIDWIHALDLRTGRRTPLTRGTNPRYAASGHLLFNPNLATALLAAPFELSRLQLYGDVVPVIEDVATDVSATMHYAVSRDLTLVYLPEDTDAALVLIDEEGKERIITAEGLSLSTWPDPRFSPDGARLAVSVGRGVRGDVWIHDLATGHASRLTYEGGCCPVWTPDGSAITYGGVGRGPSNMRVDGRGESEPLLPLDRVGRGTAPLGWTPDGRVLAVVRASADLSYCLAALSDGEHACLVDAAEQPIARLSHDGRWLAYQSDGSGRPEVYVTSFPGGEGRWQISVGGGSDPAWAPDGTEVYYRSGDRLVAAGIDTAAGVRVVSRRTILEPFTPAVPRSYDVHPDGRTLAVVRTLGDAHRPDVVVVLDWAAERR